MPNAAREYCSFCCKMRSEVKTMIEGPAVQICNECTELCQQIVHEQLHQRTATDLINALQRADKLIRWMTGYIGKMAPGDYAT